MRRSAHGGIAHGGPCNTYRCGNGLVDVAAALVGCNLDGDDTGGSARTRETLATFDPPKSSIS